MRQIADMQGLQAGYDLDDYLVNMSFLELLHAADAQQGLVLLDLHEDGALIRRYFNEIIALYVATLNMVAAAPK